MRFALQPYVTGVPAAPWIGVPLGVLDAPESPQLGDRLIHVVIDGYHAPVVEQREHDLAGASPFLRVRCRATRRSAGVEA